MRNGHPPCIDDEPPLTTVERSAVEELHRVHFHRLHRYLVKVLGDHHEAEDAAQETLIEAVRALGRFDAERGPLDRWLLGVARLVALRRLRVLSRVETPDPAWIQSQIEARQRLGADAAPVEFPDPVLEASVASLHPAQRRVISLRAIGLSTEEIATALERTTAWVYKTEQRGRRLVEQRLGARPAPAGRVQRHPMAMLRPHRSVYAARRAALLPGR